MKKFTTGLLNRTKSATDGLSRSNSNNLDLSNAPADSPEANAARGVRLFCESGSMENGGEEVLHLPVIVDAAESSPAAAAAAAQQIRKFLTREWASKPYVQYNAIMLIRILSDNPGPSFTRNFDKSFVSTAKELLRNCKDGSTQQILRETLDTLEANKQYQEGMEALIAMWRKEKGQQASFAGQSRRAMPVVPGWNQGYAMPPDGQTRPHGASRERSGRHNVLPAPAELSSRIEEAKNSAKILMQLIQSTPAEEILDNELIREFNERCQSAQRSMQGFINCENPSPDDDTMLTLIETTEQLSLSSSRYQRAVLTARRQLGVSASPGQEAMMSGMGAAVVSSGGADGPPQLPQLDQSQSGFAPPSAPPLSTQQQQYYPQSNNNGMSAFASPVSSPGEETYQAPPGPPPPRAPNHSAFASPTRNGTNGSADNAFAPPPGPPPTMTHRLNSREQQETYSPPRSPPPNLNPSTTAAQHQPPPPQSDPFADPTEYSANPAPLAFEPAHYGTSSAVPGDRTSLPSHQRTFSGDGRRVSSMAGSDGGDGVSPERVRQARWPSQDQVSEIDGHAEVGRGNVGGGQERGYGY